MRISFCGKLFFYLILSALIIFFYISVKELKTNKLTEFLIKNENDEELLKVMPNENSEVEDNSFSNESEGLVESDNLKYILQWTNPKNVPFVYMGTGREGFIERKCRYTNCFVTADKNYLGGISNFDVIAFAGPEVAFMSSRATLPKERSPHQKYAFASIESADNYPVCSNRWDGYFNWTWTFRLDSETKWGYLVVRDSDEKIIGPKKEMHWIKLEDMDPVSAELKSSLENKTKAAAWFVSNCLTRSRREKFVQELQKELKKFGLNVDIYGKCGPLKCSRDNEEECDNLIAKDYYFYLSFENSFDEDYVTEKLVHALQYNAIPIVYGGANYTRFMPDGIYLNARDLGAAKLAEKMNELIHDKDKYADYFRWKKYYRYHRRAHSVETDDYCGICALLNDEQKLKETSIYKDFRKWWDPPNRC